MNKKIIIPLALAPLAAPALQAQHQQPNGRTDTRPNIILFMVDDMGWQDTSLPSGPKRHTTTRYTKLLIWSALPNKV